ncbi:MAG TPA: hypothetical protein VMU14_20215, partial [Acidimicrobiales bacterium]|nr:hypothetical protein [Acidimicrobiales bacterium]
MSLIIQKWFDRDLSAPAAGGNPSLTCDAATLTIGGQALTPSFDFAFTNAMLNLNGQDIGFLPPLSLDLDNATLTIGGQDQTFTAEGQPVVTPPTTETPAGRPRRYREIYRVSIDGRKFEFRSLADA